MIYNTGFPGAMPFGPVGTVTAAAPADGGKPEMKTTSENNPDAGTAAVAGDGGKGDENKIVEGNGTFSITKFPFVGRNSPA